MKLAIFWSLLFLLAQSDSYAEVIIGRMIHGPSYYKVLTLRNAGSESESLSNYSVHVFLISSANVEHTLDPVAENVMLGGGEEYSICHPRIPDQDRCNALWGGIKFNGNDAIELDRDGRLVDVIGRHGNEGVVSGGWTVSGVIAATRNHNLTRRSEITAGNTHWTESAKSEWIVTSIAERSTTPSSDDCWSVRSQLRSLPLDQCSSTETRRDRVVMGTFNTYYLFDDVRDRLAPWQNQTEARAHLEHIADVIKTNRPDILTLAEVENEAILRQLTAAISSPSYAVYFVNGRDSYTGQDVGLISQIPIGSEITRTDCRSAFPVNGSQCGWFREDDTGISKNFIALFDSCLFGRKFAIVGLHLIAIPTSRSRCSKREGQARVAQDVVNSLLEADFEVMIMGDMNDFSDEILDVQGDRPNSRVLAMLRDPNNDGIDELHNTWNFVDEEDRYSFWRDLDGDDELDGVEELSILDHILMTDWLYRRLNRVWLDHSYVSKQVSDHYPIFVELFTREPPVSRKLLQFDPTQTRMKSLLQTKTYNDMPLFIHSH